MPATTSLMLLPLTISANTGPATLDCDATPRASFASSEVPNSTANFAFGIEACETMGPQPDGALMSRADDEIGTTVDALTRADLCGLACQIAYGMGCAVVAVSCPVGSAITLGGLSIPCSLAIVAACAVIQPTGVLTCTKACI